MAVYARLQNIGGSAMSSVVFLMKYHTPICYMYEAEINLSLLSTTSARLSP